MLNSVEAQDRRAGPDTRLLQAIGHLCLHLECDAAKVATVMGLSLQRLTTAPPRDLEAVAGSRQTPYNFAGLTGGRPAPAAGKELSCLGKWQRSEMSSLGGSGRYFPGQAVLVYSNSVGTWVRGTVAEIFEQACVADGYSMPAGCIKVALENDSVKYVQPEQAATVLRPALDEPRTEPQPAAAPAAKEREPPQPPLPRSAQDRSNPAPTGRADAGAARLEARDRWNTYEIRLQEIFMEYDRDNSGALEVEEFRALLRDFNEGREPTEEEHAFMMKLSDKDGDGRISLGELHYALRAWHSYRHMDDSLLRLFAEFDFDESGHLSVAELERLLTAMNGNKPVPRHEVFRVMQEADTLGDHVIHRAELLGAISAWYGNVDRKDTDLPSLLREALARTIQDADYSGALDQGRSAFGVAASMVKGFVGYSQVDDGQQPLAGASWPPPAQGAGSSGPLPMMSDPSLSQQPVTFRMVKAMPLLLSSCSKFCYVGFPFIFGIVLVFAGWEHRDSVCPRNLDGILMWFGFLTLVFSGLAYVTDPNAVVGRIAVLTILVVLNLVGFLWTSDPEVDRRKGACGLSLVYFSYLVWTTVPICSLGYLGFLVATHVKKLQRKDEHLQNEVIPVVL
ncbi:unnamed protein product [Symbiodinium sp. CCMP2592]|nr:unnamed protein product [Symbiodinium sp. CCMP2592]